MSKDDAPYITIANWNVGGARCLKLKQPARAAFRTRLNNVLQTILLKGADIAMLQEVVEYSQKGIPAKPENVLVLDQDGRFQCGDDGKVSYNYYPCWLIDNQRHSHQGKWNDVIEEGEWEKSDNGPYFAQGNAILVKNGIDLHPIWSLPKHSKRPSGGIGDATKAPGYDFIEHVPLNPGLYFGNRDTEPRDASVAHIVLTELWRGASSVGDLKHPLDIFLVNLHLTTLTMERDGVPDAEKAAEETRLRQLDIVLNQIVSPYNRWRREGFPIRGTHYRPNEEETHERYHPLWVIAGDFNFTPESTEYHRMVRRGFLDLLDPVAKAASTKKRPHTKARREGEKPTHTLDYIFAGPLFQSVDPGVAEDNTEHNRVLNRPADYGVSDHYPLLYQVPISLGEPSRCKYCPDGGG